MIIMMKFLVNPRLFVHRLLKVPQLRDYDTLSEWSYDRRCWGERQLQRIVLASYAVLTCVMTLYPPYYNVPGYENITIYTGYHFVMTAAQPVNEYGSVIAKDALARIDLQKAIVQYLGVTLVAGALYMAAKRRN